MSLHLSTWDYVVCAFIFVFLGGIVYMIEYLKRDAETIKANLVRSHTPGAPDSAL